MTDALQAAGFTRVRVSDEPVEGGLRDPMLVVRYPRRANSGARATCRAVAGRSLAQTETQVR